MEAILQVRNIRKTFKLSRKQQKIEKDNAKVRVAVDNLSFDVYKGEIYGLLGPNGAGKTTTLRILSTLIQKDAGEVLVNGYSLTNQKDNVRSQLGFLTSEMKLDEFFTPNYLFDYFGHLHNVPEDILKERKQKLFEQFGIDEFKEVKIGQLSTGMKQKVSLVISIVHDPSIVIFDEPTNGLDVITAKTVIDFLLTLKEEGKTIIVSTHIFSLIERICDRVGVIIDGQLVFEASMDEFRVPNSLEARFFDEYNKFRGIEA
ncbi:MAG: ABC transporter ATP-binding protein [Erysipelotrichaceae bacterium]|nr:ABC transporter ATP-binding protein [Erysipelotrichaceae bacterium]